ncbi:unnamed protein product [Candida verbasci]|uniref:RNA helicase n=1 Tax=Candida verbasci TaxID=1227364 RepID=A0A9W4TX18_9ASCO|nr:unnamed protein product [Candida verbasci]
MMDLQSIQPPNEWSQFFKRLSKIFFQINTHLTFLSSHGRSIIPSLELIQKLNSSITITDLVAFKYILPHDEIFLDYVDENQIMLSFLEQVKVSHKGYQQTEVVEKYDELNKKSKLILIFDFQDVKLHGIGLVTKSSRHKKQKLNDDDDFETNKRSGFFLQNKIFQINPLNQSQLTGVIRSRNNKFITLLTKFIEKYGDLAQEKLLAKCEKLIPKKPDNSDIMDVLTGKKSVTPDVKELVSSDDMIQVLKESKFYNDQITAIRTLNETTPAQYQQLSSTTLQSIHPDLKEMLLQVKGISIDEGLYTHQASALETVLNSTDKNHVIVSTSTASGKSLIYQIPILNSILWDITNGLEGRNSTAFFIFPTKALAQDQMRHFQEFIDRLPTSFDRPIKINTYDGDVPFDERTKISKEADIIFTNPDTLHASILPGNKYSSWAEFLKNLKYVVVDELHIYKSNFGINVGYVMGRLSRIKKRFTPDENLRFISCSATIQNPTQHFKTICSIPDDHTIIHIDEDGSPRCEKKLVVWNPPTLMNKRGEADGLNKFTPRVGSISECAKILLTLISKIPTIKIIIFCPVRVVCEMLMREIRHLLKNSYFSKAGIDQSDIMSYRGGYSKSDRRIIEKKMFDGQLKAIIATNALELGIDLSDLDVVISCGFPISKSNLHQQFGRAGRGRNAKGSLAMFVASKNPLDQYYLENVNELVDTTYEDLCVEGLKDLDHTSLILEKHLQCAAYEDPVDAELDYPYLSSSSFEKFKQILNEKLLLDIDGKYKPHPKYLPKPSNHVSIRQMDETLIALVDITNKKNLVIEELELSRSTFTVYEGGIFIHQGQSYLVKEFNHQQKYAKLERVDVDWTTRQRDYSDVDPEEVEYVKPLYPVTSNKPLDIPSFYGAVKITSKVFGFFKVNRKAEIIEVVETKNPTITSFSKGCWINIPDDALEIIKNKGLSIAAGVHGAAHAITNILPVFINGVEAGSQHRLIPDVEIETECKSPEKEFSKTESKRKRPGRLIFYDTKGKESGNGLSYKCFECIDEILAATFKRVWNCKCKWGCPLCIISNKCKEMSAVMSRPSALLILASFMNKDLVEVAKELPDGPEPNMPKIAFDSIEEASSTVRFSPNVKILNIVRE